MSFDIDGTEGTGGTEVLASTAPNAHFFVDGRHPFLFILLQRHHLDGSRGAVTGTVAALHTIGKYNAVFPHPYRMAYLLGTLLLDGDGLNGACGTYLRATVALGATIALVVLHLGL